jgi:hypothetical protein
MVRAGEVYDLACTVDADRKTNLRHIDSDSSVRGVKQKSDHACDGHGSGTYDTVVLMLIRKWHHSLKWDVITFAPLMMCVVEG